jgi:hypothetical protein
MRSKAIFAQQCVPKIISGYSCTGFGTRMVEAQGCPGLVVKAREEVARGTKLRKQQSLEARSQRNEHLWDVPGP